MIRDEKIELGETILACHPEVDFESAYAIGSRQCRNVRRPDIGENIFSEDIRNAFSIGIDKLSSG